MTGMKTNGNTISMDWEQYFNLLNFLQQGNLPATLSDDWKRKIQNKAQHFEIRQGCLYERNRLEPNQPRRVIKVDEVESLLFNLHDNPTAGHFGINATYEQIHQRYFWPGMHNDVKKYVQTCAICQSKGKKTRTEPLRPLQVGKPFERVGIDFVGPLPITSKGNRYIVVLTEYLTKWPEARAVPDATEESVASFFYEEIICRHGCPKELLSDQGRHFCNKLVDSLAQHMGVKHKLSSPYHPQTNGLTERFNKTLCTALSKYVIQYKEDWDKHLPSALLAYRTMKHNTTQFEPFYLLYGRNATLPIESIYPTQLTEETNESNFEQHLKQ